MASEGFADDIHAGAESESQFRNKSAFRNVFTTQLDAQGGVQPAGAGVCPERGHVGAGRFPDCWRQGSLGGFCALLSCVQRVIQVRDDDLQVVRFLALCSFDLLF